MEPFKEWLNENAARKIAKAILRSFPDFDSTAFLKGVGRELEDLELKARAAHLKDRLARGLPTSPHESFPILLRALKQNPTDETGLTGFSVWPLSQFVSDFGLGEFRLSMNTLKKMTPVFSSEFAIRPFLQEYETAALDELINWTKDGDEHVRRLVSEGSRPLLPWGQRLSSFVANPEKTWPLLEALREDSSLYVRKSVANHINDHTKNHGDWVLSQLKPWRDEKSPDQAWIIRHGLRTLIKKGNKTALEFTGVKQVRLKVSDLRVLSPSVKLGDSLKTALTIKNLEKEPVTVVVDHEVGLLKANGKLGQKVFKGSKLTLGKNESRALEFKTPLRPVTVRRYYPGLHTWTPIVNGTRYKPLEFSLSITKAARSPKAKPEAKRRHR